MIEDFDILMANYAIALFEGTVTGGMRSDILAAVERDYKLVMRVADVIFLFCRGKIDDEMWAAEESISYARSEYNAVGLSSIVQYKFLAPAAEIYIERERFAASTPAEKAQIVKSIYTGNANNSHDKLKRAMYIHCLKLVMRYRIYLQDVELTKALTQIIDGYSQEERESAILPQCIMDYV